ncbi:MAG: methyltransferase domain-containing protein [Asgard group archaeon]|nr:methyltransferase domain-containing protein [Asgard group archaeon]
MKDYPHFFHLSGVHSQLPTQEITSILDGKKIPYKIIDNFKRCLIINCSKYAATYVAQRASYCKRSSSLLYKGKYIDANISDISEKISKNIDFTQLLTKDESFCVRVYYTGEVSFKSIELEKKLGKEIWTQMAGKNKAKMKNPDKTFVVLIVNNDYFFGMELFARKKGSFKSRRPDVRPFFKPGTLEPMFARLMVNLSLANEDNYLVDPFCGPGGILVEGTLMNCNVIGLDIDKKMIQGSKKNLEYYTPKANYELILADARDLPFYENIESIATDPPYGRSTSTHGREIIKLLMHFFGEAANILQSKGCLTIGMFEELPLKEIAEDNGFIVKYLEKIYIHKSLTRRVGVFIKK